MTESFTFLFEGNVSSPTRETLSYEQWYEHKSVIYTCGGSMVIVKSTKDGFSCFWLCSLTEFFIYTEKFSRYKKFSQNHNQKPLKKLND